jgi:integrase
MLTIYRRHEKRCSLTSKADPNCPGKVKCPVWVRGTLPDGTPQKEKSLKTRNWNIAAQMLLEMEAGVIQEAQKVTVEAAIESFRQFKNKTGADNKRKVKLLTDRLKAFLEKQGVFLISDVKLPHLVAFRDTWKSESTTQRRDQGILKSFFLYCHHSDFISKNPVIRLDGIKVNRPKTAPFTVDEQMKILNALEDFPDEYGRAGTAIAAQTRAFVYVMRYTGMAIGDVTKLEKAHVQGRKILTNRKKTGEPVFATIPQAVRDVLMAAPHDSETYFFWSGEGLVHTRTSKWGNRLRKLFKLAGVQAATPHMFRHTFARDFLASGYSIPELAELLGNSPAICEKHYSKWDTRRQNRLEENLDKMRENDPITAMITSQSVSVH